MPIYEYTCGRCDHAFELLLKTARESSGAACPSCGSTQIERRLSVFAAGSTTPDPVPTGGPCGRCGDPNGPCSM